MFAANYLNNWKNISVLKGDGHAVQGEHPTQSTGSYGSSGASNGSATTPRYYKAHPNPAVWH